MKDKDKNQKSKRLSYNREEREVALRDKKLNVLRALRG